VGQEVEVFKRAAENFGQEITGIQNLNFVLKFSPKMVFFAPNFAFMDENFQTRRIFFDNFLTALN